jgi:DNA (cytosine-5)-methyltransferase 1
MGVRSDVGKYSNQEFVSEMMSHSSAAPSIADVLSDLVDQDWHPGGLTDRYPRGAESIFQENMRTTKTGLVLHSGEPVSEHLYSKHSEKVIEKFTYMLEHNGEIAEDMKTKKFAQRLLPAEWGPRGPHITATSLPDDYIHYKQPRTLTVREWARLQTFPDWYQFVGPRTTGGRRRAGDPSIGDWVRDLPKYTQIGNAVPVNLAKAIGKTLNSVIG